ncbi:B3 domain-containing protein At5g18000-like [Syzygium oleosum]|uniref:B3 domain-containing protein At5g18000-like n=1 Tax=Syzygium oleosum TaxID=219896 RepID=UPI0024B8E538|nr:B3 domain-containing protein At5g18000-like [Syzygium oleosum]
MGTSPATIDMKLLKLTWRRLEGLAARLGGAKNIFCELFSDNKVENTFWLDSSSIEKNVPRGFITQHIQEIKEIVTLRHSNRTWPVKLRSYPSGLMLFSSGWIAFVRGTGLRAGSVCVFELIDRDDIVFRVYIFSRAGRNKQSKCRMNHPEPVFCDPTPSRPLTTPKLASKFDSEHPFFKLVIHQSHFKKLHVPGQFAEQHIQKNKRKGTLRYSDRSWPVNLSRYTQGTQVLFSAGWRAFARESHLCVGNACVFELIDRDDVVFKVSIFSCGGKDQIHID